MIFKATKGFCQANFYQFYDSCVIKAILSQTHL